MTTVYLVASVVTATTVSAVLARVGPRWAYLAASRVRAWQPVLRAAPTMELLLVGRSGPGRRGRAARRTRLRGDQFHAAPITLDQGVGPRLGDVGRRDIARSCGRRPVRAIRFVALGIRCPGRLAAAIAVLVPFALPLGRGGPGCTRPHPGVVTAVCSARRRWRSASRVSRDSAWTVALVALGAGLVAVFLIVDRRCARRSCRPQHFGPVRSSGSISPSAC